MTWDNIKVGFRKLWAEQAEFRKLIIFIVASIIFSGTWVTAFWITYPEEPSWKVVLYGTMLGFLSGALFLVLLEIFGWVRNGIQKLNDIGQEEKDKVFRALKGQENSENQQEDPQAAFKASIRKPKKQSQSANISTTVPPGPNPRDVDSMLEAIRKLKLDYKTSKVTDPYPDRD